MNDTVASFTARIAPELADKVRPLLDCQPHPENARKHKIDRIKQSLLAHSQRSLIVVQKSTGYVVKGNGTWEAARQLGWEVIAQDWQELNDQQAMEYLLADNKASDASEYDVKALRGALEKMVAGPGLGSTLWEIDELEDLIAADEAPVVEAAFKGGFAETEESRAQRVADAETATESQKRREIPLVLTIADHALFVGWLKQLQKRWKVSGTMATIFAAVKRQAEAEEGVVRVGAIVTAESGAQEKAAALGEFRDLITTLGMDKTYSAQWLVDQIGLQIGTVLPPPTVVQADAPAQEDLPEGEDRDLPSHLENLTAFPDAAEDLAAYTGGPTSELAALEALANEPIVPEPDYLRSDLPVGEPEPEVE